MTSDSEAMQESIDACVYSSDLFAFNIKNFKKTCLIKINSFNRISTGSPQPPGATGDDWRGLACKIWRSFDEAAADPDHGGGKNCSIQFISTTAILRVCTSMYFLLAFNFLLCRSHPRWIWGSGSLTATTRMSRHRGDLPRCKRLKLQNDDDYYDTGDDTDWWW